MIKRKIINQYTSAERKPKYERFAVWPANLTLLPGVMQDAWGQKFQHARYPSGRMITVAAQEGAVETHQPIPVREVKFPPKKKFAPLRGAMTTGVGGERRVVAHIPERLHVVEYRGNGKMGKAPFYSRQFFQDTLDDLRPLMRSPDFGKTWVPVESVIFDWHVCYHRDEEVK